MTTFQNKIKNSFQKEYSWSQKRALTKALKRPTNFLGQAKHSAHRKGTYGDTDYNRIEIYERKAYGYTIPVLPLQPSNK